MTRRHRFRPFSILLLLMLVAGPAACDTLEILMPSRMNFPSWVLDSLRKRMSSMLGHDVSLHLLPTGSEVGPVDAASVPLILIEEGTHLASVSAGMRPTEATLDVFWMLGTRMDLLAPVASAPPSTLAEFDVLLERLRQHNREHHPWFESLESALTLFRLRHAMRTGSTDSTVSLLQNALDRKWLNPYSLESDESLAYEVFEAGDAVFTSLWVPGDAVAADAAGAPASIRFSPFPGRKGPAPVPHVRFRLWADRDDPRWTGKPRSPFVPAPGLAEAVFVPCDIPSERLWVRREGSRFFSRLIEGEP